MSEMTKNGASVLGSIDMTDTRAADDHDLHKRMYAEARCEWGLPVSSPESDSVERDDGHRQSLRNGSDENPTGNDRASGGPRRLAGGTDR